ncbi:hypothetical protein [Halobacillus karajensis]|uniref:General stress protein B n=1 Tax=Halobacillus karajensis TaxID=195088 RepID=A0A024P4U1_9BACI|nr:hypothetical protein [Halobacillus karajensis]CDQ20747.1 hypothetical protein BN982_03102 [Halobacillus karajensis]CDQ23783.1 hypothetical protein BN983_02034 [Halobacillus karajensis]CDQ27261.1 hypothetical protein BN981_01515 [Halobacillus karajensis]
MAKNNQKMTAEEAGKKGGEKTSRKYDQEHFEDIGQKGGRHSGNGSSRNS